MRARDNPFRVARLHRLRYRPQGPGWDELLARLENLRFRAAIVGAEGSGKTTLLGELADRLAARGFRIRSMRVRRLGVRPSGLPPLPTAPDPGELLFVDGADALGALARRRLLRRTRTAGGLVVTGHRSGLLPTLVECRTSPRLLGELVEDLLSAEATLTPAELAALWLRHSGNLRLALRELYDRWAAA